MVSSDLHLCFYGRESTKWMEVHGGQKHTFHIPHSVVRYHYRTAKSYHHLNNEKETIK